jgi:hypothetical protein
MKIVTAPVVVQGKGTLRQLSPTYLHTSEASHSSSYLDNSVSVTVITLFLCTTQHSSELHYTALPLTAGLPTHFQPAGSAAFLARSMCFSAFASSCTFFFL